MNTQGYCNRVEELFDYFKGGSPLPCIREIPNSQDKFFQKRKDHGKCRNFDDFRKSFFSIKFLHISEVFGTMKNDHQAKKGSLGRGGMQVESAICQD